MSKIKVALLIILNFWEGINHTVITALATAIATGAGMISPYWIAVMGIVAASLATLDREITKWIAAVKESTIIKSAIALLIIAPLLLTGCMRMRDAVPANTIRFQSKYGSLDVAHPHNTDLTNMFIKFESNGTVTASIGYLHSSNDPEVVDKAAAGQALILRTQGETVVNAFKAGADAAGNFVGAGAKTMVK